MTSMVLRRLSAIENIITHTTILLIHALLHEATLSEKASTFC